MNVEAKRASSAHEREAGKQFLLACFWKQVSRLITDDADIYSPELLRHVDEFILFDRLDLIVVDRLMSAMGSVAWRPLELVRIELGLTLDKYDLKAQTKRVGNTFTVTLTPRAT